VSTAIIPKTLSPRINTYPHLPASWSIFGYVIAEGW